ncbi:MAG: Ig-like domain-containing protein [Balneolaceae bacterium]
MKTLKSHSIITLFTLFMGVTLATSLIAQDKKIVMDIESLSLKINEEINLSAKVTDMDGNVLEDTVAFFSGSRRNLVVTQTGSVKAINPGSYSIIVITMGENRVRLDLPVSIEYPPISFLEFIDKPGKIYAGTSFPLHVKVTDASGAIRDNVELTVSSSNEKIATVNEFNEVTFHKKGKVALSTEAEKVRTKWEFTVLENPIASLDLSHNYSAKEIRTGDVVRFIGSAKDKKGNEVEDAPITYTFIASPDDMLGQGASAQIEQDGRFVANHTGRYTVMARVGSTISETTFKVVKRNVQQPITVVGKGIVPDVKTSDLWVWEGVDGRDYAITGTWGARGEAFFWDVTDPTNIHTIDTVQVDARTVNDVKVSEDGRIAVITREGASNRRNGIIILDVTDPSNVEILSEYNEDLTGGVHNTFIYEDHVYAVNNGRKYDIINIEDPKNPRTVSQFELDTPGHSIHDVWIEDGIAYSSNWGDGVVAVDIGSNTSADMPGAGGSPENPVPLGSYKYPSGWNHAAFPFKSKSTGDFYIVAGDEAFPYGLDRQGPNRAAGWVHFIKMNSWDSPEEVARYQVPEAGSHNYWIEGDILYAAFYNGGLRIVDISGELMGDLYQQGREIGLFLPTDKDAAIPNAPFTWGPMPYKGLIFLSDWNSGLWAVRVGEDPTAGTN